MKTQDYKTSINVNATAAEAFRQINNVTAWWTENLEGGTEKEGDEFTVFFGDVHVSTQKIVELVPDKKVTWLVTRSRLNFTWDKEEWTNTRISMEVSVVDGKTRVQFTHQGLNSERECYDACSNAWSEYVESLLSLINTGEGNPARKN